MKAGNRLYLRRHPFIIACAAICCLVIFTGLYTLQSDEKPFRALADDAITEFAVYTPGCRIPLWNAWDPSVKTLYEAVSGPYKCPGRPSFLRVQPNAVVTLDNTFLELYYEVPAENVSCTYQPIYRDDAKTDETMDNRFLLGDPRPLPFNVPLQDEFIKASCKFHGGHGNEKEMTFTQFLPLTPLKEDVEKRCSRAKSDPSAKKLNVIFIGIDSISRLNYIRHFTKTRQYMSEHLFPIDLQGYTKVGDNTFPNLVPILTGHHYQYYWNQSSNKSMFFDDVEFLWKRFSKHGYRTLFAEDAPNIATFNYLRNGFQNPPTDYYFRPFALATEDSEVRKKDVHCLGDKMEMEVLYNYLRSFVDTMGPDRPFFAFMFLARLTHDILNYAGYADEPTFQILRYLDESGILKKSVLVLFSDHGIRFGDIRQTYIGQYEERMPFVNLVFPRWFLRRHKTVYQNLQKNQNRLTTPFDLHYTILELLNFTAHSSNEPVLTSPGISLFREVSSHRTCTHASISGHWCTCHVQKTVDVKDPMVTLSAETVIQTINKWTLSARNRCVPLTLRAILDARVTKAHTSDFANEDKNFLKDTSAKSSKVEYLVVLSTNPGGGKFEATVHCYTKALTCIVVDDISRINKYGSQSSCISDAVLRKFCYCS